MEVSDQLEGKRLNDLFPINYFHREKIVSIEPLKFDHFSYSCFDLIKIVETGGIFIITPSETSYLCEHVSGSKELKIGYSTCYVGNAMSDLFDLSPYRRPFDNLKYLLGSKDYYHVADILYDLSNEVEEIPDRLFNYIMEICDETSTGK